MTGKEKINRRPIPDIGPRTHDREMIIPTMTVDSKARTAPASETSQHGQRINPRVADDTKVWPKPALGTLLHGEKINPTVTLDNKAIPAPSPEPQPHTLKNNPTVADTTPQPTSALGSHLYGQKTGLKVADTEAQPLAPNASANIHHPYIPITPPHNNRMKPIFGKHEFKTCICWTVGLIFLLLLIMGATVGIIFLVYKPKIPNYSVDSLSVSDLRLNFDMSLYAKFDVKITATNPNKKIGIYYRKGSKLSVWYSNTKLCQGSLPKFYQGHQNTTRLDVALTGQNQYGSTILAALQEQQQTGKIALDLKVDVPVNIELGKLKLRKIRILGKCLLTVDSLSANSLITIKASTCKYRVKL